MKHSRAIKIIKTCRTMFKYMSKAISAISAYSFMRGEGMFFSLLKGFFGEIY